MHLLDGEKKWEQPLSDHKSMILHLGSQANAFTYNIKENPIPVVHGVYDLGSLMTEDLSFDHHCERIDTIAMFNLFRALTTCEASICLQAYKTYVRPY